MSKQKQTDQDISHLDFRRDIDPNSLYELTSLLGEGSYGAVYRARSRDPRPNNEEVAIKIIPDADDDLTALWREIRFLQVLRSPFVVSFIESLLFDNELWLVMELCDGGSLYDLKEAMKTPFSEIQLKAIMSFCTLGLAHLHAQMSIHRDVKSGNVLLTRDGRAKLGDFGISAQLTDTIMKRRTVIGSPYWMAPEVIQETSYDGKADIWSLGITLLELCEGSPPHFNVHPMRAIFIISSRAAPSLKDPEKWSADMRDFIGKCLVKDCDQRSSAAELLQHPWIRKVVKEIGSNGRGLPILEQLVDDHWDSMERIRSAKFKAPDSTTAEDDGNNGPPADTTSAEENSIATLKHTGTFGIPATRQQMRNLSLKKSGYGGFDDGGDNGGTMVTNKLGSHAAYLPQADGTFKRVSDDNAGRRAPMSRINNESKDESQIGTLKRPTNNNYMPAYDEPVYESGGSVRVTSVNRTNDTKDVDKQDIQAALRYFRDDPLPIPPEPKAQPAKGKDAKITRGDSAAQLPAPPSNYKAESAILEELAVQNGGAIQNEELKKEILKQLSALKKQYREDLEALTKSYELRRKALKDALLMLSEPGEVGRKDAKS